jgi:SAM-dependent methyltransferase
MEFCLGPEWRTMLEEEILPYALGPAHLGDRVVEVGPGAGFTTEVLRRSADHVTAVELDPELAAGLRRRLADPGVTVVEADGRRTGLPAGTFTGAASFNMLHHVPTDDDQDQIFAELQRVLRPGGRLVMMDGIALDEVRAFHQDDVYHPIDPDGLAGRLGRVGFTDVRVEPVEARWYCWARVPDRGEVAGTGPGQAGGAGGPARGK